MRTTTGLGDGALPQSHGGGHALSLSRQTTLAEEVAASQQANDRLLTLVREDSHLHLAVFNVEDRVGWGALGENHRMILVRRYALAFGDRGEE